MFRIPGNVTILIHVYSSYLFIFPVLRTFVQLIKFFLFCRLCYFFFFWGGGGGFASVLYRWLHMHDRFSMIYIYIYISVQIDRYIYLMLKNPTICLWRGIPAVVSPTSSSVRINIYVPSHILLLKYRRLWCYLNNQYHLTYKMISICIQ